MLAPQNFHGFVFADIAETDRTAFPEISKTVHIIAELIFVGEQCLDLRFLQT
jgi:hypothetical protein